MQIQPKLKTAMILCFLLIIVQFLIGFLFQSSTSLRESAKRVVDLFSVGLFLFSEWISSKPANRIFTYGLGKTSALCSLVNIVIVLIGVLHFLLDTIMPDESANSWYEDTNVEMIMVYTIAVIFYVVLRLMINRKGSGKGPSVKYPEQQVVSLHDKDSKYKHIKINPSETVHQTGKPSSLEHTIRYNQFKPDIPINNNLAQRRVCCVCYHQSLINGTMNFRISTNILLYIHEITALVISQSEIDTDGTYEDLFNNLWAIVITIISILMATAIIKKSVLILLDGFTNDAIFMKIKKQLNDFEISYFQIKIWNISANKYSALIKTNSLEKKNDIARVFSENGADVVIEFIQM